MTDLISEILQTLRNNKLRTFLTGFAVEWGIFMLIVLLGMSRGVFNSFNQDTANSRTNFISIYGGYTDRPFNGYKEGRRIRLRESNQAVIKNEHQDRIASVTSTISIDTAVISTQKDYITDGIIGVYPAINKSRNFKMVAGRFINQRDLDECRKVLVIPQASADVLFKDAASAIGGTVKCMDLAFRVIGVYDNTDNTDNYAPFTTVDNLSGNTGYVNDIRIELKGLKTIEDGEDLERDVHTTLARIHQFSTDDQSAVWIWNIFVRFLTMGQALKILNIAIWVIGLFTMLSGIIGVSNIMFVSVRERTHEIGIRRAIGAKPHNILTQIILESITITAVFGYLGILFGIGTTELINSMLADSNIIKDPTINISLAINVTMVLIIAGALAGLFPAMRALKIKPVEALRDE